MRPLEPASHTTTVGFVPCSVRSFTSIEANPKIAFVGKPVDVADVFHPHGLARFPDYSGDASASRKGPSARRCLEFGVASRSPDGRAAHLLNRVVEEPEGAELPTELGTPLVQGTAESVLDGFGFGEGTADGVLDEEPTVEVVALVYCR